MSDNPCSLCGYYTYDERRGRSPDIICVSCSERLAGLLGEILGDESGWIFEARPEGAVIEWPDVLGILRSLLHPGNRDEGGGCWRIVVRVTDAYVRRQRERQDRALSQLLAPRDEAAETVTT